MVGDTLEVAHTVHHLGNASAVLACYTALGYLYEIAVYLVLKTVDDVLILDDCIAGVAVILNKELQRHVDGLSCELCHLYSCGKAGMNCYSRGLEQDIVQTRNGFL